MIPPFMQNGTLPPIRPGKAGHDGDRAPYRVTSSAFIDNFAYSPERKNILHGFLEYRKALYSLGIVAGFQWIDGSFTEDIEMLENRSPNDVDVVTICNLPNGVTQQSLYNQNPDMFIHQKVKENYNVDSYFIFCGYNCSPNLLIKQTTYWYSMWSHRRNGLWKGYLEISLNNDDDHNAEQLLNSLCTGGDR